MSKEETAKFEITVERWSDGYFAHVTYPESCSTLELLSACLALMGDCRKILGIQPEELAAAARDVFQVNDEEGEDDG